MATPVLARSVRSSQILLPAALLIVGGIALKFLAHYALPYFRVRSQLFRLLLATPFPPDDTHLRRNSRLNLRSLSVLDGTAAESA